MFTPFGSISLSSRNRSLGNYSKYGTKMLCSHNEYGVTYLVMLASTFWMPRLLSGFPQLTGSQSVVLGSAATAPPGGLIWVSLVAQMVKKPPATQETRVQSLGWEDPLEKEMATHSSILAWDIPWTEESGGLQSIEWQRVDMTRDLAHTQAWGPWGDRLSATGNLTGGMAPHLRAYRPWAWQQNQVTPGPHPDQIEAMPCSLIPQIIPSHSEEAHREPRVLKPPHKASVLKSRTSSSGRQSEADEWIVAKWKVLFKKYDFLQLGFLPNVPNVEIAL